MRAKIAWILALLVVIAGSGIVHTGCGSKKPVTTTQEASKKVLRKMPEWVLEPPREEGFIFESGTATSRDLQVCRDKAADAARLNIARSLETRFNSLTKRFQEEVGTEADAQFLDQFTQATKAVVSTTLVGLSTEEAEVLVEDGVYRAYVLLKLPLGAANKILLERLKQQEELFTRFRSSEIFQELESDVTRYEDRRAGGD